MESVDVSVVLPVYNGASTLERAIESVLKQNGTSFELIIINDGSTDDSRNIIKSKAKADERIVFIDKKSNEGIVAALQDGIEKARGKYVARIDADDAYMPNKLKEQSELLDKHSDIVLVSSAVRYVFPSGNISKNYFPLVLDADLRRDFYIRNPLVHGSCMFRLDTYQRVGGYSDNVGPTEDYDLWIKLASEGKFAALPILHYMHTENPDGISKTNTNKQEKRTNMLQDMLWQQPPPIYGPIKLFLKQRMYSRVPIASKELVRELFRQQLELVKCYWNREYRFRAALQFTSIVLSGYQGARFVFAKLKHKYL